MPWGDYPTPTVPRPNGKAFNAIVGRPWVPGGGSPFGNGGECTYDCCWNNCHDDGFDEDNCDTGNCSHEDDCTCNCVHGDCCEDCHEHDEDCCDHEHDSDCCTHDPDSCDHTCGNNPNGPREDCSHGNDLSGQGSPYGCTDGCPATDRDTVCEHGHVTWVRYIGMC